MRKRITPAMIVALIALFTALAGTATAAGTAVLITSKQIKDGSIQLADVSPKAKKALKGEPGPRGFTGFNGLIGPTGPAGAPGAPGANGGFDPSTVSYHKSEFGYVAPGATATRTAYCPAGHVALSGGVETGGASVTDIIVHPMATTGRGSAMVTVVNDHYDDLSVGFNPHVVCAAR